MQRRDNNFQQPLGICQRLFNFIMNNLIGRGLQRVITAGGAHPPPSSHESNEVPIEGPSSSEIIVEFKHANGLEHWSTPVPKKGSPLVNGGQKENFGAEQGGVRPSGSGKKEIPLQPHFSTARSQVKAAKKVDSIKEIAGEKDKNKKKDKNYIQTPDEEAEDTIMKPSPRRPFLNNINEKSDEFIRKKKEDLRRTNTLEQF